VPPKDSNALATALAKLLGNSSELDKWKNQGRQNLERFSVVRVNEETVAVYHELVQKYVPKFPTLSISKSEELGVSS
jgi:glycosyltransferase involved in cell wall biosynthesis